VVLVVAGFVQVADELGTDVRICLAAYGSILKIVMWKVSELKNL
jgi:hypothetical protein